MDSDQISQRKLAKDVISRMITVEEVYQNAQSNIILHRKSTFNENLVTSPRNRFGSYHNSFEKSNHCVRSGKIYKPYKENVTIIPAFQEIEDSTDTDETDCIFFPIEKQNNNNGCILMCMLGFILLIILVVYLAFSETNYVPIELIEEIKNDLQTNILQQDEAINVITHNLNKINAVNNHISILPFVGTTGVGKTFTVNIIKKRLPSLTCELSIERLSNPKVYDLNYCNIIVIDNLKASNLDAVIQFIQSLLVTQTCIVIPVFNIHNTENGVTYEINKNDFKAIREKLDASGIDFEIALFNELKHQVVEQWLRQELSKRQIEENKHNDLIKLYLSDNQVKFRGFKGLAAKLKVTV